MAACKCPRCAQAIHVPDGHAGLLLCPACAAQITIKPRRPAPTGAIPSLPARPIVPIVECGGCGARLQATAGVVECPKCNCQIFGDSGALVPRRPRSLEPPQVDRPVVTVQQTSKAWKLVQVCGAVGMVVGMPMICAGQTSGLVPAGLIAATLGVLTFFVGRFGAWWCHG